MEQTKTTKPMTKAEILRNAIEKAESSGFKLSDERDLVVVEHNALGIPTGRIFGYETIIFSHDFAKAFWGERFMTTEEEDREVGKGQTYIGERWQYHLQQMVLESDPISYLEQFI